MCALYVVNDDNGSILGAIGNVCDGEGVLGLFRFDGNGLPVSFLGKSDKRHPGADIRTERVTGQFANVVIESNKGNTKSSQEISRPVREKDLILV
jgi:hypothetical protein